ncbi:type II restriction enzyme [Helicobacter cetorum MIT 99-5656]|uniref:Type II restriction enzyme n=1 Tax=Helicobacter cetorum (strain ATCC BAA-540 / CCUG 52418 / MIT 99-5656) TaxID=1163745 RepID=I0ESV2_HELCM|nr:type II restriction enzyme [Helicobacter cetorum MIT 99-5656]
MFQVYPIIPKGLREIDSKTWSNIEYHFKQKDNLALIIRLLHLDLFPIKGSDIAYLKRDGSALKRNPRTINRICGRLYEMELNKIFEKCSEPKETNRQA